MPLDRKRLRAWLATAAARARAALAESSAADEGAFLPDFCHGRTLLRVVLLAEMLALTVTLVTRRISANLFIDLFMISLFVQWIALTSAATLCALRGYLNRLPWRRALMAVFLLLLVITFALSEAAVWVLWTAGRIDSPRPEWYAYFHIQNLSVAAVIDVLALNYLLAMHRLRQRTLSEARAKLQTLRARLRPHFLFNSMNIIASLIRTAPARAETAIEDMADLFRMMLGDDENLVPVRNEIAVARKYLNLEALRLDGRLDVDWDIGSFPRKAVMPILTLQPLLEHAIQFGVEALAEGGRVAVKLWEQDECIHIRVSGPQPGARAAAPLDAPDGALEDIRQRLASHYNEAARLEVARAGGRCTVTVTLPMRGGHA